ncbi:MAG: hypothetical protein SF187_29540 [Deltaproteobacteria bacterium]|nr:hypothetical protein [Deltaproteobacteria bacterium]
MITRRCLQRMFLLRPDDETTNAFIYCLAIASKRSGIAVHGFLASSNHYHAVITDVLGLLPEFLEYFHRLLAKHQNALHGRCENMWSCEKTSVVWLVSPDDIIEKLVYTLANPVKDQLVEQAHHWPGATSYHATLHGKVLTASRPRRFFRTNGKLPPFAALACVPPQVWQGEAQPQFVETLKERIRDVELAAAKERQRLGSKVIGRKAILSQSPTDSPSSPRTRNKLRPVLAAKNVQHRNAALAELRRFRNAYLVAREAWRSDKTQEFPIGTWWIARYAGARCAPGGPSV